MESNKTFLYKSLSTGLYILRIVKSQKGKRIIKKISCETKNKRVAVKFLNNYVKKRKINTLKLTEAKIKILNYVKSNLSSGSCEKYELMFKVLIENFGDKEIDSIRISDIELLKTKLNKKIKKDSVNSYLRSIKAAWNLMVKLDMLKTNKLKNIQQFKIPEKQIVSFSQSEIEIILNSIEHQFIKRIIKFALYTGMRISELLNMKIKNIDFANEWINVSNSDEFQTKSRKNRIIPFNTEIKEILNELIKIENGNMRENDKYLFARIYNVPFKRNHVTRYFRKLLDKLNFDKRYHFHCLRATFIMNLVRKGISPIIIQKLVGHSTLSVTQRYCFVQVEDLRKALNY